MMRAMRQQQQHVRPLNADPLHMPPAGQAVRGGGLSPTRCPPPMDQGLDCPLPHGTAWGAPQISPQHSPQPEQAATTVSMGAGEQATDDDVICLDSSQAVPSPPGAVHGDVGPRLAGAPLALSLGMTVVEDGGEEAATYLQWGHPRPEDLRRVGGGHLLDSMQAR